MYGKGNDMAADDYADALSQDQAYGDEVERIAMLKYEDADWRASAIDELIGDNIGAKGVSLYAYDLADLVRGYDPKPFFSRMRDTLMAKARDESEEEIEEMESWRISRI